jgi:hypothetical protein
VFVIVLGHPSFSRATALALGQNIAHGARQLLRASGWRDGVDGSHEQSAAIGEDTARRDERISRVCAPMIGFQLVCHRFGCAGG